MSYSFQSYPQAAEYARETSIKNPGIAWFVNWIEDDEWSVSMFEDYLDQEFWMNGQRMVPEFDD